MQQQPMPVRQGPPQGNMGPGYPQNNGGGVVFNHTTVVVEGHHPPPPQMNVEVHIEHHYDGQQQHFG